MKEPLNRIQSLPPIIDQSCTRLILGSIPGEVSLAKQEYYGHPQNAFWRILFALYETAPTESYAEKQAFLLSHHIALWDVIGACQREGSLDQHIQNAVANDFASLFREYPSISRIYFNGAKAFDTYRVHVGFDPGRTYTRLPSTSPAHAVPFEQKLSAWHDLL